MSKYLCGCRVGALAAGGGGDAVSLKDLLSVLQHRFIAELQVELEAQKRILNRNLFMCKTYLTMHHYHQHKS